MGKKFDFAIGNPPYQTENKDNGRQPPVYHEFMDAANDIADVVELITPARFLFNAGQTPKSWNKKMLENPHFKVLRYEANASVVFPNTDIKGGVVISLINKNKNFGKIGTFTPYEELNSIVSKVSKNTTLYLDEFVSSRGCYRLTESFFDAYPDAQSRVGAGTGNMIVSNIFEKIPEAFYTVQSDDNDIKIVGREKNKRTDRYISKKYIIDNEYLNTFNVMVSEGNGSGKFGEALSSPFISKPLEGATDTFLSIGTFDNEFEANSLLKYIKTKFLRALLGVNKATQHTPKKVWKNIPVENFTNKSDINWNLSVKEIDKQLYTKYELTAEEINFIESNVKEME